MDPNVITQALGWYIAFLISTVLHEAAHALAALKLGDPTAYQGGQVTVDPIPHIRREPFGMLIVPLLSFVMGGWMFGWGSAPYDPHWALNHPKKSAWMALAGPGANLLLVILTGVLIRMGLAAGVFAAPQSISLAEVVLPLDNDRLTGVATFISIVFSLNLILLCFNLLPIPPLDGSTLPLMVLAHDRAQRYMEFLHHPQFFIIGIFLAWNVFDAVFDPIHLTGINILYLGIAHYG